MGFSVAEFEGEEYERRCCGACGSPDKDGRSDDLKLFTSSLGAQLECNMSRVLVIRSDTQVSREIGDALSAAAFPMEFSAGDADALQRLRMRSFGVVITSPDSAVDEDLALLERCESLGLG